MKRIAVAMLLLGLCCSGALAVQTLNLASGYVQLPNASVVRTGDIQLYAANVRSEGTNELSKLLPAATDGIINFNLPYIDNAPGFFINVSFRLGR